MSPPYPLEIVVHDGQRYLANTSPCSIRQLTYSVAYSYFDWDGGTVIDSAVPRYEMHDIPAHGEVRLVIADSDAEAIAWCRADEVVWEDGRRDEKVELVERRVWEPEPAR